MAHMNSYPIQGHWVASDLRCIPKLVFPAQEIWLPSELQGGGGVVDGPGSQIQVRYVNPNNRVHGTVPHRHPQHPAEAFPSFGVPGRCHA